MGARRLAPFAALLLGLLAPGEEARAGGFVLYEFGAGATGMCGAQTAGADDPAVLFFNPAAITRLERTRLALGVSLIKPVSDYAANGDEVKTWSGIKYADGTTGDVIVSDGTHSVDQEPALFTPPHLYATHRFGKAVSFGFGLFTPYGLGVNWPRTWDGRYIIKQVNLETFTFNPVLAVDLAQLLAGQEDPFLHFSVAVGYMGNYSRALLDKNTDWRGLAKQMNSFEPYPVNEADLDGIVRMEGTGWANSFNAAVHLEIPKLISAGFQYRHHFELKYDGTAEMEMPDWFTQPTMGGAGPAKGAATSMIWPKETDGTTTMYMPTLYNMGVALLVIPNLVIEADLFLEDYTSYKELKLEWGCNDESPPCNIPEDPTPKDWTWNYQAVIGAAYTLQNDLTLRLGFGRVGSPVPEETYDPVLPDGERTLVTLGAGMPFLGMFRWDLGYMFAYWQGEKTGATKLVDGKEVPVNDAGAPSNTNVLNGRAIGKYTTMSHILALTIGAEF